MNTILLFSVILIWCLDHQIINRWGKRQVPHRGSWGFGEGFVLHLLFRWDGLPCSLQLGLSLRMKDTSYRLRHGWSGIPSVGKSLIIHNTPPFTTIWCFNYVAKGLKLSQPIPLTFGCLKPVVFTTISLCVITSHEWLETLGHDCEPYPNSKNLVINNTCVYI